MLLSEFIEKLQALRDSPGRTHDSELKVCVRVTGCLSSHTCVPVRSVGIGFDWEKGRLMITTEEPVCRHYTPQQIEDQRKEAEAIRKRTVERREAASKAKRESS